jgi:hypothetical protein
LTQKIEICPHCGRVTTLYTYCIPFTERLTRGCSKCERLAYEARKKGEAKP